MTQADPIWRPYQDKDPNISAYVHWLRTRDSQADPASQIFADMQSVSRADALAEHYLSGAREPDDYVIRKLSLHDDDMRRAFATRYKLLKDADSNALAKRMTTLVPPADKLPVAPDVRAIVGVIDTDIALGHRAFRDAEGASRVLAAWQMEADGDAVTNLPLGHALYRDHITELLKKHSDGKLDGQLDAHAFNSEAGLLSMAEPFGPHALAGRFAHGTHVMDLAAGCGPNEPDSFARQIGIISVTLPSRRIFGESGEFLDLFMVLALQYIHDVSDAIWKKNQGASTTEVFGYPTVVNLSFGRQAASKNPGIDLFPQFIERLKKTRKKLVADTRYQTAARFEVVMPAGNDNQDRVHTNDKLAPDETLCRTWRLQPGDQSGNFVEIWADNPGDASKLDPEVALAVFPPGADETPSAGDPGTMLDPREGVRIYCLSVPEPVSSEDEDPSNWRGFLICTAPTESPVPDEPVVPAGAWTIKVRNVGKCSVRIRCMIQTDQSTLPSGVVGLRSYFDDENYQRFNDDGSERDAILFAGEKWEVTDNHEGATRHGSMNASSFHKNVSCVGGYRLLDGCPAPYSAAGLGAEIAAPGDSARRAPTASLPTDDSRVHAGLLAAGASDGSCVPMRGTSFASALATRYVAQSFLEALKHDDGVKTASSYLYPASIRQERDCPFPIPYHSVGTKDKITMAKLGGGRIPHPKPPVIPRLGHR